MLIENKDKLDLKIGQRSLEARAACLSSRQEIKYGQNIETRQKASSLPAS